MVKLRDHGRSVQTREPDLPRMNGARPRSFVGKERRREERVAWSFTGSVGAAERAL